MPPGLNRRRRMHRPDTAQRSLNTEKLVNQDAYCPNSFGYQAFSSFISTERTRLTLLPDTPRDDRGLSARRGTRPAYSSRSAHREALIAKRSSRGAANRPVLVLDKLYERFFNSFMGRIAGV